MNQVYLNIHCPKTPHFVSQIAISLKCSDCENSENSARLAELYPVSNFHSVSHFHAHFVCPLHPPPATHLPSPIAQTNLHPKVGRGVCPCRGAKAGTKASTTNKELQKDEKLHLTSLRVSLRTHTHTHSKHAHIAVMTSLVELYAFACSFVCKGCARGGWPLVGGRCKCQRLARQWNYL